MPVINKKHKKTQGFTLLEVIIAIAVLTMLITPIFAAFAFSIRSEQRALLHTLATYTAQMKMEEAYGMDKAALVNRFNTTDRMYFATTGAEEGPADFYYEYTAKPTSGSTIDDNGNTLAFADLDLYTVTIVVGYEFYDIRVTIEDVLRTY